MQYRNFFLYNSLITSSVYTIVWYETDYEVIRLCLTIFRSVIIMNRQSRLYV